MRNNSGTSRGLNESRWHRRRQNIYNLPGTLKKRRLLNIFMQNPLEVGFTVFAPANTMRVRARGGAEKTKVASGG